MNVRRDLTLLYVRCGTQAISLEILIFSPTNQLHLIPITFNAADFHIASKTTQHAVQKAAAYAKAYVKEIPRRFVCLKPLYP